MGSLTAHQGSTVIVPVDSGSMEQKYEKFPASGNVTEAESPGWSTPRSIIVCPSEYSTRSGCSIESSLAHVTWSLTLISIEGHMLLVIETLIPGTVDPEAGVSPAELQAVNVEIMSRTTRLRNKMRVSLTMIYPQMKLVF